MSDFGQIASELRADPRKAKMAAGALAAVVAFALYRRHQASSASSASSAGGLPPVAGLSGTPNTAATDGGNDFQNQLNALEAQLSQSQSAAAAANPADSARYVRYVNAANPNAIYQIENGKVTWLSAAAWGALARLGASLDTVTTNDTSWSLVSPHQAPAGATDAPKPGTTPGPVRHSPLPLVKPKPAAAPNRGGPTAHVATYTVPQNGSLYGAAQHFYGANARSNLQALAVANNIKLTVRNGQTYATVRPGQIIKKP